MTERFNVLALMPPSEVELLALDLLADLAPMDRRPESAAAVAEFTNTVIGFCQDWRSLWHQYGDTPGARGRFEDLAGVTQRKLRQLPPVRVASIGSLALKVLKTRLLTMLFGGEEGLRPEATEFDAGTVVRPGDAPAPPATEDPTFSSLPTEPTSPWRSPRCACSPSGAGGLPLLRTLFHPYGYLSDPDPFAGVVLRIDRAVGTGALDAVS